MQRRTHGRMSQSCLIRRLSIKLVLIHFTWFGLQFFAVAFSFAADATFSKDGKHVYAIEFEESHLFDIDIDKQSASKIDIGPQIENEPIVGVATSNSGDLLVATANAAWSCNIDKKSCTKLCTAPEGIEFKELAYDPKGGGLLFVANELNKGTEGDAKRGAFFLPSETKKLQPVDLRQVAYLAGITFSEDGQLFFGTNGDLWQGFIRDSDYSGIDIRVLKAIRCCPLANLKTFHAVDMPIDDIVQVAAAKDKLYGVVRDFVGAKLARLNRPTQIDDDRFGDDEMGERLKFYRAEISSVEVLAGTTTMAYLAASLNGKCVFFTTGSPRFGSRDAKSYLVENNGLPRELKTIPPKSWAQSSRTAKAKLIPNPAIVPPGSLAQPSSTPTPPRQSHGFEKELEQQMKDLFPNATPRRSP